MAFVTDRRTQTAVFVAVASLLVGLAWIGLVGAGAVELPAALAVASFAAVTTLLLGVNLWLAWNAMRSLRASMDDDGAFAAHGPYHKKPRGLRR